MKKMFVNSFFVSTALAVFILSGCSESAPACSDNDVKQMVIKSLDKELKDSMVMGAYQSQYPAEAMEFNLKQNTAAMVQAMLPGLDTSKTMEYPKNYLKVKEFMETKAFPNMKVELKTIQSTSIDDKIKRSECTANLTIDLGLDKNSKPSELPVTYSAQKTDDSKELIVKAAFKNDESNNEQQTYSDPEE